MVLRGFDLAVQPGQIHALLGRNGSGKTTALRILLGFLQPHRGRSTVLGIDSACAIESKRVWPLPAADAQPTDTRLLIQALWRAWLRPSCANGLARKAGLPRGRPLP